MIILFVAVLGFLLFLQFLHFFGNNRQKKLVLVCSLGHNYQNLCAIKFGFFFKYFNLMFSVLYPFLYF